MPTAIPDRYKLEVRLGRDGDIEEWLATDTSLDRPVLIRSLGPESTPERRSQFVNAVASAARITHTHLARVFAVNLVEGGAYAVSEWTGGATVADRVAASQPIDLPDFLPNASGLAGALAVLHGEGAVHGRIDTSAISYSGGHPAKLGAFGRPPAADESGDVRALAAALETGLTGAPPAGPPPSERVDGVPRAIDTILRSAQSGRLSADELENALLAAPTPRAPAPESGASSRRLIFAALGLITAAVGLVVVGFVLSGGSAPVIPTPTTRASASTTVTSVVTTTLALGQIVVTDPATLDPYGEGGENDQLVNMLIDRDMSTEWRTEHYNDPLSLLKPGVGVTLRVTGTPQRMQIVDLTPSTVFEVYWSEQRLEEPQSWDRVAGASASPAATFVDLPPRTDGYWLIWLTDLPVQDDGRYVAAMSEVRFLP